MSRSFRPEFLNRLDRVVVFRPLGRDIMRGLLEKELTTCSSAAASACSRGRSSGTRPRRLPDRAGLQRRAGRTAAEAGGRAVLLTRIATAIVERQFPEGDQFLFITARDGTGLDVAFVDPDAGEVAGAAPPVARAGS